jgi:hypothetical protein
LTTLRNFLRAATASAAVALCMSTLAHADENPFGKAKGWSITAVTAGGALSYCSAERDNGQVSLRVAFDGETWKIGMPYYENGKVKGSWGFDGLEDEGTFVADGEGWAFMKLTKPMRKSLRNQASVTLELDRGMQTFDLDGIKAGMKKVRECVKETGGVDSADESPTPRKKKQQQSAEAMDLGNGMFSIPYAKVAGWEVAKYSPDARGRKTEHCTAIKTQQDGVTMRFGFSATKFQYGFNAPNLMTGERQMQIRFWFDDDADSEVIDKAKQLIDTDGSEWYTFEENNADGPGMTDGLANFQAINFAYKSNGKQIVETFDLKGSNKMIDKLIACGHGE